MGRKIAIVGAGAVGGYVGAHMVQAGADVTFIDPWPEHIETIRSRGHGFSAISRKTLLRILQDRARELGVELRFEQEVTDLQALPQTDLLVGADGIHGAKNRANIARVMWGN